MEVKQSIKMFGHTFTVWQGAGRAVLLQVDDVYLAGDADEHGNFVIPRHLLISNRFEAMREICEVVNDGGSSIAFAAMHFHRKHAESEEAQ